MDNELTAMLGLVSTIHAGAPLSADEWQRFAQLENLVRAYRDIRERGTLERSLGRGR